MEKIDCSICMEEFHNPRMIPCGHSFCSNPRNCLSQMLRLSSPPRCAVCNHNLPRDLKEEDVPRNFALSAAIDAMRAGPSTERKKTDSDVCTEHNKTRKFFCRPCSSFVCKKCWEKNHMDSKTHEVVPFSSISESCAAVEEKLTSYRQFVFQLSDSIAEVSEKSLVLRDVAEKTKDTIKLIREASGPMVLDVQVNTLKQSLETSQSILTDISNRGIVGIQATIEQAKSKLQDAANFLAETEMEKHRTSGEGKLKETRLTSIVKGNVVSIEAKNRVHRRAAVDENGNVICIDLGETKHVRLFEITEGELRYCCCLEDCLKWDTFLRRSYLSDIACFNGQFIVLSSSLDGRNENQLHLLDKSTLEPERELHLKGIDKHGRRPELYIGGCDEWLGVLIKQRTELLLYRGPEFRLISCVQFTDGEINCNSFLPVPLCSKDALLVTLDGGGGNRFCLVNVKQNGSSFKRVITIDGFRELEFVHFPKSDSLQGYLCCYGLDEDNERILEICFLDLESVQDGDVIKPINNPSIWNPTFRKSLRILCARWPGIIFCQDNWDIFRKQANTDYNRRADFTTLTFR